MSTDLQGQKIMYTILFMGKVCRKNVFLELSCFFDDPVDVGNLISGSSAFSKTSFFKIAF